jgi:hypothetical protein
MVKPSKSSLSLRSQPKRTQPIPRQVLRDFLRIMPHVSRGVVALSNASTTSGGLSFKLDDIPNFSRYTAIFDRYRIQRVEVSMYHASTTIEIKGAASLNPTLYCTVIDYNSSGAAATFNDLRTFRTCKVNMFGALQALKGCDHRSFQPRYIGVVEDATTSVVKGSSEDGWLNTETPNVPYFGYRYFFDQLTPAYTGSVKFECVYHVEFVNSK